MVGDTMTRKYGNFSVYSPRKKDLKNDLERVRDQIGELEYNHGKRYSYIPDLIDESVDKDFYVALDSIRRLSTMNLSQTGKLEILNILMNWYESKLRP